MKTYWVLVLMCFFAVDVVGQPSPTSDRIRSGATYDVNTKDLAYTSTIYYTRESTLSLHVASTSAEEDSDVCSRTIERILKMVDDPHTVGIAYDSAKATLIRCAGKADVCALYTGFYSAAISINTDAVWLDLKDYLRTTYGLLNDDCSFCAALYLLAETEDHVPKPDGSYDVDGAVAVLDYAISLHRCDSAEFAVWRYELRRMQVQNWRDTVRDSLRTPLDTENVSLESIGLGYLKSGVNSSATAEHSITSWRCVQNPASHVAHLRAAFGRSDIISITLVDLLGHELYSLASKHVDQGLEEYDIPLPFGTAVYYARLSTLRGETRTVKILAR